MSFSDFVGNAIATWGNTGDKPVEPPKEVTRDNSVVAAYKYYSTVFSPRTIRACIQLEIEERNKREAQWPYRYDRSSLEAVIQLETFLGRTCGYENAQAYIDRRIEERKEEIRVSNLKGNGK
jgi:hypothetical protein